MAINHTDKCWWKTFCQEAKRAYRRKDIETMAHLYELYEQHMHQRLMREYHYYKRLDYKPCDVRAQSTGGLASTNG